MDHACRSVRTTELTVLDLEVEGKDAASVILAEARLALSVDKADCIVLGCAGMADLVDPLARELGVPVVDGVACGVKILEGLLDLRLSTSRSGGLARPIAKPYTGELARFQTA